MSAADPGRRPANDNVRGHPVEHYYKDGITISSPEELESTLIQLINRLLIAPRCSRP
jgi:hypothetical protein